MTAAEVREKFEQNASLALDDPAVAALEAAVLALEEHDDVGDVCPRLAAARVAG
jgi:hypothetical protein